MKIQFGFHQRTPLDHEKTGLTTFDRQECGKCSLQECFNEALLFFELLNAKKLFGNYSLRDRLSFFCY